MSGGVYCKVFTLFCSLKVLWKYYYTPHWIMCSKTTTVAKCTVIRVGVIYFQISHWNSHLKLDFTLQTTSLSLLLLLFHFWKTVHWKQSDPKPHGWYCSSYCCIQESISSFLKEGSSKRWHIKSTVGSIGVEQH